MIFWSTKEKEEPDESSRSTICKKRCESTGDWKAGIYTTGVPAMIGAALVVDKVWDKDGVFNIEEFDPDPFMDMLNQYGLPWVVDENPQTVA